MEAERAHEIEILLRSGLTPHGVSLEDLATTRDGGGNVLGFLHHRRREDVVLGWLAESVVRGSEPRAVLDVGCAYGHHLFRLDRMLGKSEDLHLVGVDLFDDGITYANTFAREVPGFSNCSFQVADLSKGLPFDGGTFDAVNLADVLEHLEQPAEALRELVRVAKPSASIVISTPLRDSLFKRVARVANQLAGGRLYKSYYAGKGAKLDETGEPVMETPAGLPHVSEMSWSELRELAADAGLAVRRVEFMSVLSGSRWFDEHKLLLSLLIALEGLHDVLQRPSWAHSVVLDLRPTS